MNNQNQTIDKKAVAYIRISSQRQVNNESPETQRSAIQAYADSNNIEITEWFEDIAKSGKNADRTGLQNLLKYCGKNRGKIQHWIVYNMKRASRDIDTYSNEIRATLKVLGVTVRSATEPAVDDSKEGRFMENILIALGQLDNESKSDVTKDNMTRLSMQGWWQGPAMVGYDTCKKQNDLGKLRPTLKPNSMAPIVTDVLERFSQGNITKAELTRYAAAKGLRSRNGNKISEDRIHALIKHSAYAGYVANKQTNWELVEGKHPAIISRETYRMNQSLLYGKRKRAGEVRQMFNPDYPLKGLLLCPNCNKALYASAPQTGAGGKSPRYHCSRPQCKGKNKSIKADIIHADFLDMLKKIKPDERVINLYKEILRTEASSQLKNINTRISKARIQLNTIDEKRLNVIKKFSEDKLTIDEKNEIMSSYDEEKFVINNELHEMERKQGIQELDIIIAIGVMRNVDEQWEKSSPSIKVRFQSILFPEGLVYDYENHRFGTSQISPLYRYVPNKKDLPESEKSVLVAGSGFEPLT